MKKRAKKWRTVKVPYGHSRQETKLGRCWLTVNIYPDADPPYHWRVSRREGIGPLARGRTRSMLAAKITALQRARRLRCE